MNLHIHLIATTAKTCSMQFILHMLQDAVNAAVANPSNENLEKVSIANMIFSLKRQYEVDPNFDAANHVDNVMAATDAVMEANKIINTDKKE